MLCLDYLSLLGDNEHHMTRCTRADELAATDETLGNGGAGLAKTRGGRGRSRPAVGGKRASPDKGKFHIQQLQTMRSDYRTV